METAIILRNRVRELRSRLNLRQADLAKEVNVTRQTIIAIEKGRLNPSITICLKIARVLREPVDYVFYLDHAPKKEPARVLPVAEPAPEEAMVGSTGTDEADETPSSVFRFE